MGRLANLDDEFMPYLTNHASARMGSRHISPTEVAFVMNYGRSYHVRGAVIYVGFFTVLTAMSTSRKYGTCP